MVSILQCSDLVKSSDDTVFLDVKIETFQEQGNKNTRNAATKKPYY